MKPEIHVSDNTRGIPAGDYVITQFTGNYGMGSEEIYYDISMRHPNTIERMYGNYDRSRVNMYDPYGTKVFSSSMQKKDMSAFDIENIYVNEKKEQ